MYKDVVLIAIYGFRVLQDIVLRTFNELESDVECVWLDEDIEKP